MKFAQWWEDNAFTITMVLLVVLAFMGTLGL